VSQTLQYVSWILLNWTWLWFCVVRFQPLQLHCSTFKSFKLYKDSSTPPLVVTIDNELTSDEKPAPLSMHKVTCAFNKQERWRTMLSSPGIAVHVSLWVSNIKLVFFCVSKLAASHGDTRLKIVVMNWPRLFVQNENYWNFWSKTINYESFLWRANKIYHNVKMFLNFKVLLIQSSTWGSKSKINQIGEFFLHFLDVHLYLQKRSRALPTLDVEVLTRVSFHSCEGVIIDIR